MFGLSPRRPSRPAVERLDDRVNPVVIVVDEVYQAAVGSVLEVGRDRGLLANDFSDTNADAVLAVTGSTAVTVGDFSGAAVLTPGFPRESLTVNPDGSFRLVIPSDLPRNALVLGFTYTVANALDPTEPTGDGLVSVYLNRGAVPRFAVGADAGAAPAVAVFDATNNALVRSFLAYEPGFTGGVRVATADLTGDGVPEVITAPGDGGGARVRVFEGRTFRPIFDADDVFDDPDFRGGAFVAAGDVNDDQFTDLIIGAGAAGGPRVVVLNGQSFIPAVPTNDNPFTAGRAVNDDGVIVDGDKLADFFAYESAFTGGVRVAAGDFDGNGRDYILTAPGAGGGPVVKQFDFFELVAPPLIQAGGNANNQTRTRQPLEQFGLNENGSAVETRSFLAGNPASRNGAFVAAGDLDGDGRDEVVVGDAVGAARVRVFDARTGGQVNTFVLPAEPTAGASQDLGLFALTSGETVDRRPTTSGSLIPPVGTPGALVGTGPAAGLGVGADPTGQTATGQAFAGGGARVATVDRDGDGKAEVVAAAGPGNPPRVRVLTGALAELSNVLAFPANQFAGVNVG